MGFDLGFCRRCKEMGKIVNREEKIEKILAAKNYRSNQDSVNSVYMNSMTISTILHMLGGSYQKDSISDLIYEADEETIDKVFDFCKTYIDYMEKHPTKKCLCCGQIVSA